MKRQSKLLPVVTILLLVIIFSGCAVKTKMLAPPPQAPVLKYVMPDGQTFTYKVSSGFYQTMSIRGIPLKTTVLKDMIVTFYQIAFAEEAYQVVMMINDVSMKVTAPGTNITPDLSKIPGNSFEMTVTNSGEEIGLIGADELTYTIGKEGEHSLESEFEHFFPDLPEQPLLIGDTWTTTDTIDASDSGMETIIMTRSENTLAGYELIKVHECAKITSEYTSTVTSSGIQEGANIDTTVEMEGTEILYFDYKMGVLVLQTSTGSGDGTVKVSGQKEMTLSMSQTVTNKMELVE